MDSLVGTTVADRYYVLSILGTGGMSVVYKAKSLRRSRPKILAIKTLRTQELNDEVVVKRFQREAELLIHLNHPRIVQVHDHGYTGRGQPYFVMDYLVGQNLSQIIRKYGPLEPRRVRYIFSQVCGAVDHAHRCGVIHRDLKPGNIMLLDLEDEQDFVKVVDFGIARFQTETNRLTRLGEVWGSPVYMSPEQCMGKAIDARSDVYSVGIAMYEALTGEVPFLGKNYVDTMSKQITEPPRPMSEICPDIDVPERLEKAVFKALHKEPHERHQSMAELREEIEDAFGQMPTSLRSTRQRFPAARSPASQRSSGRTSNRTTNSDMKPLRSSKNDITPIRSTRNDLKSVDSSRNDLKPARSSKTDMRPLKTTNNDMRPLRTSRSDIKQAQSPKSVIASGPSQFKFFALVAVACVLLFLAAWGLLIAVSVPTSHSDKNESTGGGAIQKHDGVDYPPAKSNAKSMFSPAQVPISPAERVVR
jgi:serine/threonine protein kinase